MADQDERQTDVNQADLDAILEPSVERAPELINGQPDTGAHLPPDRPERAPRSETSEDRLTKALQTIESMQQEITHLKSRPATTERVVYDGRRDALPEMIEVLPGRHIPKDPNQRAIKLRAEDLVAMGWNEDPARALNALGNALFHHIAEVIPQITLAHIEERGRGFAQGQSRQELFFRDYPDLKEFGDLADIVERQTMNELPMQGMTQGEWNREVGTRVRQRIAAMRGISLDQYTASIGSRPAGGGRSRAVTAPSGRAPGRAAPTNDQQREMDALMDGRFG